MTHQLAVLDATEHDHYVLVVLDGTMVYAEDTEDEGAKNSVYDALFVANALAKALDTPFDHVMVPPLLFGDLGDVYAWWLARRRGAALPKSGFSDAPPRQKGAAKPDGPARPVEGRRRRGK